MAFEHSDELCDRWREKIRRTFWHCQFCGLFVTRTLVEINWQTDSLSSQPANLGRYRLKKFQFKLAKVNWSQLKKNIFQKCGADFGRSPLVGELIEYWKYMDFTVCYISVYCQRHHTVTCKTPSLLYTNAKAAHIGACNLYNYVVYVKISLIWGMSSNNFSGSPNSLLCFCWLQWLQRT